MTPTSPWCSDAGVPVVPLLPADVEQAAAHHLPPAGRPLHRHGLHRGLGLPRPPPAAHPPPLQHPQLAGARHHGYVPPTVRVRPLQLPAAHVLQLSHSLLQVDRYISTYLHIYLLSLSPSGLPWCRSTPRWAPRPSSWPWPPALPASRRPRWTSSGEHLITNKI